MTTRKLAVEFGEQASHREFAIEVFRASKLPRLKRCLTDWERYEFIR
jgi:hypothetical protein